MNKKVLRTLEYHKIIDLLVRHANCDAAKKRCKNLIPMTDLEEITSAQRQTGDALNRIFKKGNLSFLGVHDITASMKRLEIGAALGLEELLRLASLLEVAKRAKTFSRNDREDVSRDSLDLLFDGIEPLTPLLNEIRRCIISSDEISDEASSNLKSIRRSIKGMQDRIHAQINNLLNSASASGYLQDNIVTMRNGRYCLPVKAEHKNQVSGMVHDQSSTGSTLFIEPLAIVNLNNELKELSLKEQEEIEKILADLSNQVSEYIPYILENYRILVELDFIFAKALLAKDYNGVAPVFNTEGRIRIRKGRHPLLSPKKVIPIDIHLGTDFDLLIITGPNTGGKTVSLKTVGLFTLMGQAGLHISANDNSELSVFTDVFADIGDEQSIEQNLSTFSSHMTNIVSILEHVSERSLVLFDELCAGTDPTEGAALAISILSQLHSRGIRTMATTHYSEIKVYAISTEGVENACCEFDMETLSPTYRLLIGIPGKSNAFAISKKLGLSDSIIEDAKSQITENEENFEDLIARLEDSRVTIEKEQLEISSYKAEIESLKRKLEEKQKRLDNSREKILQQANEEAHKILSEAKEFADLSIRNFQKYGTVQADNKTMEGERAKLRKKMGEVEKKMTGPKIQKSNTNAPKKLRIGDSVKVLSMNLKGTVHTLPDAKGNLFVQMGILRSQVNLKDLVLLPDDTNINEKKFQKTSAGKIKMSKSASISTEIKLLGMTVDEALNELDKYLDDAYLAHLSSVRIVHGKGTGALRNAVHAYLRKAKYVKNYRLAEFGEGDAGVTIAEFK
ncbi:MAG: endonuclease MutS2 [Lachnospiraceae bacterium]|nr:endonuclease MutS2 [Lachnospiraceae bacterium]